jgi:hypothetical protein
VWERACSRSDGFGKLDSAFDSHESAHFITHYQTAYSGRLLPRLQTPFICTFGHPSQTPWPSNDQSTAKQLPRFFVRLLPPMYLLAIQISHQHPHNSNTSLPLRPASPSNSSGASRSNRLCSRRTTSKALAERRTAVVSLRCAAVGDGGAGHDE